MESKIKWVTLENETGERSLKQHGFVADDSRLRRYTNEKYTANISLCGRVWVGNDNEDVEDFDKIISEPMHTECCRTCFKKNNLWRARPKQ